MINASGRRPSKTATSVYAVPCGRIRPLNKLLSSATIGGMGNIKRANISTNFLATRRHAAETINNRLQSHASTRHCLRLRGLLDFELCKRRKKRRRRNTQFLQYDHDKSSCCIQIKSKSKFIYSVKTFRNLWRMLKSILTSIYSGIFRTMRGVRSGICYFIATLQLISLFM